MKSYLQMSKQEQKDELALVCAEYEQLKTLGLKLDMSRGKPNYKQLDLSMDLLGQNPSDIVFTEKGVDARNYGELTGVEEAKQFFADVLGVEQKNIIIGGQASLALMYDCVVKALILGVLGGAKPWGAQGKIKFLCPAPGYDRHFAICEHFGMEMINIPMLETGPDMDLVKKYVESDASVKGIWCVPKYSNPQGIVYSDDTVRAFAKMNPAADDFRIFWDNAYFIHFNKEPDTPLLNIFDACREEGSEDMVYEFFSTSKITFSGAGIAVLAASENNIKFITKQLSIQTIGNDKINQLRHVKYFKDVDGIKNHMKKHAAIVRPKFECVLENLDKEIAPREIGEWLNPNGGYFVSYDGLDGTAKRCVQLCKDAGVVLTGAGAAFPYGVDPDDKNVRIAPTYPDIEELAKCMELFCICQRIAALELLISK